MELSHITPRADADRASASRPAELAAGSATGSAARLFGRRLIAPLLVLVVTSIVYAAIYFREDSIPTAIGANLVPAERVLKGEVPYRDFYKIQTPGILLLNAALFRLWGTSLLTAMTGVLVFKLLTITMVFTAGRLAGSLKGALLSATLAVLWLAPGGPFRPAPIQYEMLFIVSSIYFVLRWLKSGGGIDIFSAGLAVGMVAIFKQNVGVYTAIALALSIVINTRGLRGTNEATGLRALPLRSLVAAGIGIVLPLAGLFFYLAGNRALGPAIDVFVRAPGEHIQSRFVGYALPRHAVIIIAGGAGAVMLAARLVQRSPARKGLILWLIIASAALCSAIVPQPAIENSIYWFSPPLFAYAGWNYFREKHDRRISAHHERASLLVLLLFALAAYGEVFPRSVRGLVIGAFPPAFLLLAFLLDRDGPSHAPHTEGAERFGDTGSFSRRLAVAVTMTALLVFALRVELPEYFAIDSQRGLSFKADTELKFDRGRGTYMPASRAEEVNATVDIIRSRVEEGGYFFAHALDASSYYFLSARNSPTGATLWNDTGTDDRERVRTMAALKEKDVRLVLTSEQAMKAEEYRPLLDYLSNNFHQLPIAIGKTVFLERNR